MNICGTRNASVAISLTGFQASTTPRLGHGRHGQSIPYGNRATRTLRIPQRGLQCVAMVRPSGRITATDGNRVRDEACVPHGTHIPQRLISCALALAIWFNEPVQALAFKYGDELLFQPLNYVGRWYEVSSLKRGFSGAGQEDCHCTQGIYTPKESDDEGKVELTVNTFCVHGSPTGRVSGIQGAVTCANPILLKLLPEFKTELDKGDEIVEKCVLRFPSIPFVPPQPYNIIRTDYSTYALVRGSTDKSFIQIYSRTPNPGPEFIQVQKDTLASLGYPVDDFIDTPQDCDDDTMMTSIMSSMDKGDEEIIKVFTNTMEQPKARQGRGFSASGLETGVQFDGFTQIKSALEGFVKLFGR